MNKRYLMVWVTAGAMALTASQGLARWKDEGQSEKYLEFWEKSYRWESASIEGYKLLLDQQYTEARGKLEEAIALGCPLGKVYFQLGLCLDKLHSQEGAVRNYRRALEILKESKEKEASHYTFLAHYNLGVLYIEQGMDQDAVREFESACAIRPEDASAYVNLGYLYSRNHMDEKAVEAYRNAISRDPQLALAHYNLGVLLRNTGRGEDAQGHLDKARALDPELKPAARQLPVSVEIKDPMKLTAGDIELIRQKASGPDGLTAVGNLHLARGEYHSAVEMYDRALAADPDYVHAHVGRAQALLALGDAPEAQKSLFRSLELNPDNVQGRLQLGKVYFDLGRIQMARKEFEKAHALDSKQIEVLFYLGAVNEYAGDERYGKGFPAAEALKYYQQVLEQDPNHLQARTNMANVYARSGEWEKARAEFENASVRAAASPHAHYNLGYIYDELGLYRESITEYRRATELDPQFSDAYFNLGYVYTEFKLFKHAERQYYKVLDIDREYADAYFNLGVLYDRYLKDKKKAHTYYHEYALRRPGAALDERKILKKRILKLYP